MKEVAARIKINKLPEFAGWQFFPNVQGPANIQFEANAEAEQALVTPNRALIEWIEKKIQATLDRIWGDEE